jgi:hypothetical protein
MSATTKRALEDKEEAESSEPKRLRYTQTNAKPGHVVIDLSSDEEEEEGEKKEVPKLDGMRATIKAMAEDGFSTSEDEAAEQEEHEEQPEEKKGKEEAKSSSDEEEEEEDDDEEKDYTETDKIHLRHLDIMDKIVSSADEELDALASKHRARLEPNLVVTKPAIHALSEALIAASAKVHELFTNTLKGKLYRVSSAGWESGDLAEAMKNLVATYYGNRTPIVWRLANANQAINDNAEGEVQIENHSN